MRVVEVVNKCGQGGVVGAGLPVIEGEEFIRHLFRCSLFLSAQRLVEQVLSKVQMHHWSETFTGQTRLHVITGLAAVEEVR